MAGGSLAPAGVAKERAEQYQGRVTSYVIISCIVAAIGGSIFGYDIGISGGVTSMNAFLEKFFPVVYKNKMHAHESNYCKYNNQVLATFTSSLYLAGLVATLVASPITRIYGRRTSIICGGISFLVGAALNASAVNLPMLLLGRIMLGVGIGFGNQVIVAIILGLKFGGDKELSKSFSTLVVVVICLFVAAFGWSWGPLGWTIPSEIFPLETRSAGQSITVAVNLFFTFVIAQSFLSLLCGLKFGIFLFFAGWVTVMTVFVYLFLPETKGVPIEEMILLWRKHWFWKRIVPGYPEADEGDARQSDSVELGKIGTVSDSELKQ